MLLMGKKLCTLLNYEWEGIPEQVEDYLNKALCYGVFATNSRDPVTGEDYIGNPDGYERDAELLNWFIPNVRKLSRAGWEPVTFAEVITGSDIHIERYGSGHTVYLAVMSEYPATQQITISVDLDSLGFEAGEAQISEIARNTSLTVTEPQITLTLDPYKTCILRLRR